jgi:hypothetical protein
MLDDAVVKIPVDVILEIVRDLFVAATRLVEADPHVDPNEPAAFLEALSFPGLRAHAEFWPPPSPTLRGLAGMLVRDCQFGEPEHDPTDPREIDLPRELLKLAVYLVESARVDRRGYPVLVAELSRRPSYAPEPPPPALVAGALAVLQQARAYDALYELPESECQAREAVLYGR